MSVDDKTKKIRNGNGHGSAIGDGAQQQQQQQQQLPQQQSPPHHHHHHHGGMSYGQVTKVFFVAVLFGMILHSQLQTQKNCSTTTTWKENMRESSHSSSSSSSSLESPLIESARVDKQTMSSTTTTKRDTDEGDDNEIDKKGKDKGGDKAKKSQMESLDAQMEDKSNRPWPRIAWLMSFPNSGTSYTSKMVRYLSDLSTATNYGDRHINSRMGRSVPVYNASWSKLLSLSSTAADQGPFWTEAEDKFARKRPTNSYVITKTHCGGSCALCGPYRYIETPHSFMEQCESGLRGTMKNGKRTAEEVRYDSRKLVSKAIHLIRHPLDNAVSRFHLEWNENHKQRNGTESLPWIRIEFPTKVDRNPEGFRVFCQTMAQRYAEQEEKSRFVSPQMIAMLKDVPCYGDLMRWIQWHNLALWTTRELQVPTYVLYYENYTTSLNATVQELVDFLQFTPRGPLVPFISGKSYAKEYYTKDERKIVKKAMQLLAYRDTWKLIEHYF